MTLADFLIGAVALAIFLLPGWVAARIGRLEKPWLAGFIASTVALVTVLIALDAVGSALTLAHVLGLWVGLTAVLAGLGRKSLFQPSAPGSAPRFAWREHWPLFLVLVPAFAVVIYRAGTQPLFGIDTVFRWNYLAQQMFARASLGFYPPVTVSDYEVYAWPDGIAPAVSAFYFWCYSLAGAARPGLTTVGVVFQYVLLVAGTFALARRLFSDRAAAFACALLACSPVISWATAMGRETGLTALALVGLLLYLPRNRTEETTGAMVIAGLAAGLGGLAREYGLAFIAFGCALAVLRRLSARSLVNFTLTAALAVLPWYLRNWLRTGNPLFNLDVAGWFPVNRAHVWLMQSYQVEFGWATQPFAAYRFLVVNCLAALLGALAGIFLAGRAGRTLLAASAVIVFLWATSLGYTAAGFTTAIRVLNPALVLGTVLGGATLARWLPGTRHLAGISLALGLLATDAALRALTLPGTVYKIPPGDWLTAGGAVHAYHARPIYAQIAQLAGPKRILVLGPNAQLTLRGARTVPLWSPDVAFLFDPRLKPAQTAALLRQAQIGFIFLNRGPANERYLVRSPYFRDPGDTLRVVMQDGDMLLLKIVDPS